MALIALLVAEIVALAALAVASFPSTVPSVQSFTPAADGSRFTLPAHIRIVVASPHANSTEDVGGMTLIPPSLFQFAQTFAADVPQIFPGPPRTVALTVSPSSDDADIFLTIGGNASLANGAPTSEGYAMDVTMTKVTITGAGARGVWWGTRTLLQALVLGNGSVPTGKVVDQPDWRTRGFMLDVGRQWYPLPFLKELCSYASWYKISEFHTHLSDNLNPGNANPLTDVYARFRLRPESAELAGLAPHLNETYSREEFDDLQTHCAGRGVTIVPELEAPGHALVIVQWKPELGLTTDLTLLNLSVPDTLPTVQAIWKEFLPWFHSKQVSIGADEYNSSLADDYNNFVNNMSSFIHVESNKTIRIWGTNEPSNRTSVSKNITIQHWEFFEDDPFELIRAGYNVINSDDGFQYIVMKQSGSYPQRLDQNRLWTGANTATGGTWDPHIFDRGNASNNPRVGEPLLQGSIQPTWNDHGPNASTPLEAFYAIRRGLPVVAASSWLSATRPSHLTQSAFDANFHVLEAAAPAQNLDRRIKSKTDLIVQYSGAPSHGVIKDTSGNGYDAKVASGRWTTPLGSKGHNYTLLVTSTIAQKDQLLLSGPDTSFGVVANTLALMSSNITYPLRNFTLPPITSEPHEIVIVGAGNTTMAWFDKAFAGEFMVQIGAAGVPVFAPMAFVAPLASIGGDGANVTKFALWNGVKDVTTL